MIIKIKSNRKQLSQPNSHFYLACSFWTLSARTDNDDDDGDDDDDDDDNDDEDEGVTQVK